jgi:hypothetical protein
VPPDSFAGAVVEGTDPLSAQVLSTSTRVQLEQLERWALRHTRTEDRLVLEASGNAFAVAERLRTIGRKVDILDSHRAGKVGKVYCANDRVDAVKIARIYLSALSPIVWQPDEKTLERREIEILRAIRYFVGFNVLLLNPNSRRARREDDAVLLPFR